MDKVQKIREEVEIVVNRRLNLLNGDYFDLNKEADGFINEIMDIIDTTQEDHGTSDWLQELESMSDEQVKERLEKVNAWYNEQFVSEEPASENLLKAYYEGYHQAEKDLELDLEDIKTIDKLLNQCVDYSNPYQEVLKRFKERKEL